MIISVKNAFKIQSFFFLEINLTFKPFTFSYQLLIVTLGNKREAVLFPLEAHIPPMMNRDNDVFTPRNSTASCFHLSKWGRYLDWWTQLHAAGVTSQGQLMWFMISTCCCDHCAHHDPLNTNASLRSFFFFHFHGPYYDFISLYQLYA